MAHAIPAIECDKSRILVIDADCKDGQNGPQRWQMLILSNGLTYAPQVRTRSGGLHVYFRQPEGERHGNARGGLKGRGIDVRGVGGYVIGPGATLPNGERYEAIYGAFSHIPTVPDWLWRIIKKDVPESEPQPDGPSPAYIQTAFEAELRKVRGELKGGRNEQLNLSACAIGHMVGAHWISLQEARNALYDAAVANGSVADDGPRQARQTIDNGLKWGMARPRETPQQAAEIEAPAESEATPPHGQPEEAVFDPANDPELIKPKTKKRVTIHGIDGLERKEFMEPRSIVDGILPEGCTMLGGRPKMGKSWLALDIARGVSTGKTVMGRECLYGGVLYCALEDNERRLQSRYRRIADAGDWVSNFQYTTDWPKGEEAIAEFSAWGVGCKKRGVPPVLIIVDTIAKVKKDPKGNKGETYTSDYDGIALLQRFSIETGISTLLITHTVKRDAEDVYDTITGTLGNVAAVDTIMVMARQSSGAIMMHGRGRDIEEYSHPISFNKEACRWEFGGSSKELAMGETRQVIITAMEQETEAVSPSYLGEVTGLGPNIIKKALARMVEDGAVKLTCRAKYVLPYTD